MSSASSTARQEATAWTTVQTPQIRWVKAQASRGSRPCMMISIPRNWVEVAQALAIRPFSAWASIRRCPSIRVMGSTTTRVLAMGLLLPGGRGSVARPAVRRCRRARAAPALAAAAGSGGRRSPARARRRRPPPRRASAAPEQVDPAARRRTLRRRAAGRRTASSCPRSRARCSRCRDARRRSASWSGCSTGRSGRARRSRGPCSPPCRGTTPCGRPRRRTLRRTGRHRSWRAGGTGRGSARRRRRGDGPRHRARAAG